MKYALSGLMAILMLFLPACSEKKRNEDIFTEFEGEKGFYMVKLPPALFLKLTGMGGNESSSEDMGNVDLVKLLIYSRENDTESDRDHMYDRISGKLIDYQYENIFGFNSDQAFISAYILENDEYVSDLMILFRESESLACLGLSGRLNGEEILKFAAGIEYNKLRNFINQQ
ncbi:MAG: DUF4252 domain-containing protein [Bacteroidales bacterium]|nr:DUF4252 domain-containing protein [Bacteroidales bacterium]